MNRSMLSGLVLAALTIVSVPAFADGRGDAGRGDAPKFPVAAADFQGHVEARLAKRREHLEAMITKRGLDAAKAQEVRARFDEGAAKVRAEVAKVAADGVVTADEAKEVRETAHAVFPHHGHGRGGEGRGGEGRDQK